MRGILNVLSAERRRRWGSWLALALLVTVVGGTVLAGITAARRTESAFPAFVARTGPTPPCSRPDRSRPGSAIHTAST